MPLDDLHMENPVRTDIDHHGRYSDDPDYDPFEPPPPPLMKRIGRAIKRTLVTRPLDAFFAWSGTRVGREGPMGFPGCQGAMGAKGDQGPPGDLTIEGFCTALENDIVLRLALAKFLEKDYYLAPLPEARASLGLPPLSKN